MPLCNPMIRSERNIAIIVIEKAKTLLLNIYGASIATASIGVKFGGCGINLPTIKNNTIYRNGNKLFFEVILKFDMLSFNLILIILICHKQKNLQQINVIIKI